MKRKDSRLYTFGQGTKWNFWKPKVKAGVHSWLIWRILHKIRKWGERALIKCAENDISELAFLKL